MTGDLVTTSTTWTEEDSFSITLPEAQKLLVGIRASWTNSSWGWGQWGIGIDSDTAPRDTLYVGHGTPINNANGQGCCDAWLTDELSAGAHTVRLFRRVSAHTGTFYNRSSPNPETWHGWALGVPPGAVTARWDAVEEGLTTDFSTASGSYVDATSRTFDIEMPYEGRVLFGVVATTGNGTADRGTYLTVEIDGTNGRDAANGLETLARSNWWNFYKRTSIYGISDVLQPGTRTFQAQIARWSSGTSYLRGAYFHMWAIVLPENGNYGTSISDGLAHESQGATQVPPDNDLQDGDVDLTFEANHRALILSSGLAYPSGNVWSHLMPQVDSSPAQSDSEFGLVNDPSCGTCYYPISTILPSEVLSAGDHTLNIAGGSAGTQYIYNVAVLYYSVSAFAWPVEP